MPSSKEERRKQWREWYAKNPEARIALREKCRLRRLRIKQEKSLLAPPVPSVSEPENLPDKHVVLSRLLRRLLAEAYHRGYLSAEITNDDTAYEMRVRAALDVSKCLAEKQDEANNSGGDSPG